MNTTHKRAYARVVTLAVAGFALAAIGLSGCASSAGAGAGAGAGAADAASASTRISVVASTNVYGDIAAQIGGHDIRVTSIMSNPAQDPHSFEANVQNQLELSKANIVIQDGGGYDDFVNTMLASSHNSTVKLLNAVKISGFKPDSTGDINEHVWYDFQTMRAVVAHLVSALSADDPAHAAAFKKNAAVFDAKLGTLEATEAKLRATYAGIGAAITEPVPLYMLSAIGLVNKTPAAFSHAIEDGTDVSPAVLQQTLQLYSRHQVKLLAYNEQTTGPETDDVLNAAKSAHIAVVAVTETLPSGKNYISWMTDNLDEIAKALGS